MFATGDPHSRQSEEPAPDGAPLETMPDEAGADPGPDTVSASAPPPPDPPGHDAQIDEAPPELPEVGGG